MPFFFLENENILSHNKAMNKFRIKPGMDKLKVFIELVDESDFGFSSVGELLAQLKEMNIVAGIDDSAIKEAFVQDPKELLKPLVIARGKLPGEPVSARFDFQISINDTPQFVPDEDEAKLDYKEAMKIELVDAGDYLGEYFPAEAGSPGFNVYGNEITSPMGDTFTVVEGEGVRKEGNKFYATKTGKPSFALGRLEVKELLEIEGDVSFETGNIDFPGSIVVKGAVLDGFKVVAGGDLEVFGVIGNSEIQVGGLLKARGGIIAKSESLIKATSGMEVSFVNNALLESKGDICVTKNILHSRVHSLGYVKLQKGSIIGGEIVAAKGVDAFEVGSESGVLTKISIKINYEAVLLHDLLEKILESTDQVYQRNRGYLASNSLPQKAQEIAVKDIEVLQKALTKAQKIQEQIHVREKMVENIEGVCLRTHKRVWGDVIVRAPGCLLTVKDPIDGQKVFIDDESLSTLVVHNG